MFKKFILKFLFLLLILSALTCYAQTDTAFLTHASIKLSQQPISEKVYLHLNKPGYAFGDTIWYKAYTVIGGHHQLSALSGVLYVEMISPKDSLITRQILPLTSGIAWSDIPLAHTLRQGLYHIRAYTNWMRNFDAEYFYDQPVRIGGIPPSAKNTGPQPKPDVQFFPEGGELVSGVRSRVAIKAVSSSGLGEDIGGTITDNDGNVVADFSTQHLGMGVFAFIPQSGKTYRARISTPGEAVFMVDLPKAKEEGFTLTINNSRTDSIGIKVAANPLTLHDKKDNAFFVVAQSGSKVYYTSAGKLDELAYIASVEKSRFPSGIIRFTLFSQNGEPVAERIAFIQNNDSLKLGIDPPAKISTARSPVKINLTARDSSGKPIGGSFSVAVINESMTGADENSESTITSSLLLTSELKGHIEQPGYYFATGTRVQRQADMDVLMLTQGYRRFEWKQVLSDTARAVTYQPEKTLELNGTITSNSNKPIPNGSVTLMANKENLLRDTAADAEGHFKFSNLKLSDTINLVLKARKINKDDHVKVMVDLPIYPAITPITYPEPDSTQMPPQSAAKLKKQYDDYQAAHDNDFLKDGKQLRQVNIQGYKRPKEPELTHSSNLNGPGHANQIIMGNQIEGCIFLSDCLAGKVFGVRFSGGTPLNLRKSPPSPMVIIVDGVIMNGNHLDELNANDIYSIEVLRSGAYLAIYGTDAPGGALVITSKRGGEDARRISPKPLFGLTTYTFKGYQKSRSFYSPKYSSQNAPAKTDLRTAIYWNPNILTDKEGKATFDYFNADTRGTYRIVIEGIDDNGNLGRRVYRYKVE